MHTLLPLAVLTLAWLQCPVAAQQDQTPENSFPHVYPGQPDGDFSPAWQNYFLVNSSQLPNVTFPLPRSFAGNLPVNRSNHPNDTLFFWGFEKTNGSLTEQAGSEPWLLWLQGGPGSSSLAGLLLENGPLRVQNDLSFAQNNFSWDRLVDSIWVDQPVGVGFGTADSEGYVADDEQMASDFLQFLANLVKVFPNLSTRPLIIAGESYAGRWIPYITKALFSTNSPPVKLSKISIGDGTIPSGSVFEDSAAVTVIETFPQLVNYDTQVLQYFLEQRHLCGYDLNLTYPQQSLFPTLAAPSATDPNSPFFFPSDSQPARLSLSAKTETILRYVRSPASSAPALRKRGAGKRVLEREARHALWKRDLTGRANGTIDSWYACNLLEELYDYAVNFTFPWSAEGPASLNVYDIPDATNPEPASDVSITLNPVFFNDNRTRTALHAPTSKDWAESINYPFNNSFTLGDISPDPQVFFSELATNASARNVSIVLYAGNLDSLVSHHGIEISIQNTTFGGIQGFSRKPSTPWFNDDGTFAGVVHQERNLTYVLFDGASHLVPNLKPAAAFVFLREFVLGSNQTGLVQGSSVVGGENATLAGEVLPAGNAVFVGSLATQSTVLFPSATIAAWDAFVASATSAQGAAAATAPAASGGGGSNGQQSSARRGLGSSGVVRAGVALCVAIVAFAW